MADAELPTQVALRPWPADSQDDFSPEQIQDYIIQLSEERGFLRYITEHTLQDEIESGRHGDKEDEHKQRKPRQQVLADAQMQMFQDLQHAFFFAGNGLDLASLILSKDSQKKDSELALTPEIRRMNFTKGFSISKGQEPTEQVRQARQEKVTLLAKGSRMLALESASDTLLKAATRLRTEARKERTYWDELTTLSQKRWPLQRYQRSARHTPIAVQCGYPEASRQFKSRALAPLRMDKEGHIALKLRPRTLRVRVCENGKITGTSSLSQQENLTTLPVEKSIKFARDSLFEEELFHEIALESRELIPYEVELRASVIHFPARGFSDLAQDSTILIDCVPRDETTDGTEGHLQDSLARNVAEGLRMLLAHEHSTRLYQRTRPQPPVMSNKNRQAHSPALLRIVLALFSHIKATTSVQKYMERAVATLNSAGLQARYQSVRETALAQLSHTLHASRGRSPLDNLLEAFSKPLNGVATLTLASPGESRGEDIKITTRTFMGTPTFGTEYTVMLPPVLANVMGHEQQASSGFKFSNSTELIEYLDWKIALFVAQPVLINLYRNRIAGTNKEHPGIAVWAKGEKKAIKRANIRYKNDTATLKLILESDPRPDVSMYAWNGSSGNISLLDSVRAFFE